MDPLEPSQFVSFEIEGQRYAFRLAEVETVLRMVRIVAVPGAPPAVTGIIDIHGQIVPVIDLRRRFRLPVRTPLVSDQLVVVRPAGPDPVVGRRGRVAVVVDVVAGVIAVPEEEIVAASAIAQGLDEIEGVARLPDGMVVIHSLRRCLSIEESRVLDGALERYSNGG